MRKNVNKITPAGKRLKKLLKKEQIKQNEFARLIDMTPSLVSDFIYGRVKEGGIDFWDGIRKVFPDWEDEIRGYVKIPHEKPKSRPGSTNSGKSIPQPYEQIPEHIGVPKSNLAPDSDRGSYGVPDLDGFKAKELFIPEEIDPFAAAVSGLKEIFESRDPIIVSAIQANVRAFQLSVRREYKINLQSKEIDILKEKCNEFEDKLAAIERKLEKNLSSSPEEGTINKKAI